MTSYVQGTGLAGAGNLDVIELRVISNLLQSQNPASQQDELRVLRNDQAFELGFVPANVPGN